MLEFFAVSAQTKVFLDERPLPLSDTPRGFLDESISFQAAVSGALPRGQTLIDVRAESDLKLSVRAVECVPVTLPTFADADGDYLRVSPGLYPDLLRALPPAGALGQLRLNAGQWRALWIEIRAQDAALAGAHTVTLTLVGHASGETLASLTVPVEIYPARLPAQRLIRTNWLHADCLANYYHIPVFSEEHWRVWRNFIQTAVKRGINMQLTPLFTPPLDTAPGGERPTVQLVDVAANGDAYTFGFDRLRRYVRMCLDCGNQYFELSHLFTQWGAAHAPKIMGQTKHGYQRLFGWETDAQGAQYAGFLSQFLPALDAEMRALGVADKAFVHLSDEPSLAHFEAYSSARALVRRYLPGYPVLDAMRDIRFFKEGAVDRPVCAINHISPFLESGVKPLWGYYCVSQYKDVSNLFIAMPPRRTRALGVQLYKYQLEGFLQWGYNFYNTQLSVRALDPYFSTDAEGAFPAGDPFQVYPGADGMPEESIRLLLVEQAMQDLRALEWLERLAGRDFALSLIARTLGACTFDCCPQRDDALPALRAQVDREILARL